MFIWQPPSDWGHTRSQHHTETTVSEPLLFLTTAAACFSVAYFDSFQRAGLITKTANARAVDLLNVPAENRHEDIKGKDKGLPQELRPHSDHLCRVDDFMSK